MLIKGLMNCVNKGINELFLLEKTSQQSPIFGWIVTNVRHMSYWRCEYIMKWIKMQDKSKEHVNPAIGD